jgi:copper homeostasis protein
MAVVEGVDGIVMGCLTSNGDIDEIRLKQFIDLLPSKLPITFHRAIDMTRDPIASIHILMRYG